MSNEVIIQIEELDEASQQKAKNKSQKKQKTPAIVAKKLTDVKKQAGDAVTHYCINTKFEFFQELSDLILKSSPAEKSDLIKKVNKIGRIKLVIISGIFMNKENTNPELADLVIVGEDINRRKLLNFLKTLEAEVGTDINYVVMDKDEFQYRLSMFDRFVSIMLESSHEKLINKLGI